MTKKLPPGWSAKHALDEARRGDPSHLISRLGLALQGHKRLSDGEFWFIVEALEATESRQTRARLRDLEFWLIAHQFDGLVDEENLKPKQAMDVVKKHRDCSVRTIRTALKAYGKPRRYRG